MARNLCGDDVPHGWNYDLLDKFAVRCSGHTPSKSVASYWNGGVKWISLSDTYRLDRGYVYETEKEISPEGVKNSSAEVHPAETVVLSRDAGIGKSGVMASPMAVSQHFIAWKCDNHEKIHSWYLYNWLQFHKKEFERQAVGSTIKTIGLPYFKKLKIALPPFSEQKKIAQILSTWDRAITTTEQLLANSQQQKKALMQHLLTGQNRLPGFGEQWKKKRVDELVTINYGKSPKEIRLGAGEYPVVGTGGITGQSNSYLCREAAVVIGRKGTIDKPQFFNTPFWAIDTTFYCLPQENVDIKWFFYLMTSINLRDYNESSGLPSLSRETLYSIVRQVPSKAEQQRIAKILSAVDQGIVILGVEIECLKREKNALMQQLLTGKRRVIIQPYK